MMFAEFVDAVRRHYGEEAAAVRHELFFLSQRSGSLHRISRAVVAALRDAYFCWRLPMQAPPLPRVLAVVTLAGSNGKGALEPALAVLRQRAVEPVCVIHPRLRGHGVGQLPCRLSAAAWRHAVAALWSSFPNAQHSPVSSLLVRLCVLRFRLWRGVWERTLAAAPVSGTLLLHNDFDLFSAAAVEAGRGTWRSVCVQHGLPTDEFFPTRAERHVVWGHSSKAAYHSKGTPIQALRLGPRRWRANNGLAALAPQAICVISQTHTPVFGLNLEDDFLTLAQYLAAHGPLLMPVQILLHPEEVRGGHPYRSAELELLCCKPPHAILSSTSLRAVVIGFCSTALLEAALQGHYVIGVDWSVPASTAAIAVGRPVNCVSNNVELLAVLEQLLQDPEERAHFLGRQERWLQQTFQASTEWLDGFEDEQ